MFQEYNDAGRFTIEYVVSFIMCILLFPYLFSISDELYTRLVVLHLRKLIKIDEQHLTLIGQIVTKNWAIEYYCSVDVGGLSNMKIRFFA